MVSIYISLCSYFSLQYQRKAFTDVVSGENVNLYIDCFGDQWLKNTRWGLFRVKSLGGFNEKE